MAVLVVHGVNTREPMLPRVVERFLRRYLAGALAENFHIEYAYWGDLGGVFRFDGASRPRTRFVNQGTNDSGDELLTGAEFAASIAALPAEPAVTSSDLSSSRFTTGGPSALVSTELRMAELERDVVIEFLSRAATAAEESDPDRRASLLIAIEDLREDEAFWRQLRAASNLDGEMVVIDDRLGTNIVADGRFVSQGINEFTDTVREGLTRFRRAPARAASAVLGELRPKLDGLLEQFIGDVLTYVDRREPDPVLDVTGCRCSTIDDVINVVSGQIPARVLSGLFAADAARRPDEPLVVLTHSMGGQIVYDIATTFLRRVAEHSATHSIDVSVPTIDLWCATASQVGFFEELGLFLASDAKTTEKTPFPGDFVRSWWNVWDHNDLISYTAEPIFEGVDDTYYKTGNSLVGAHSAYLERPSFYKDLVTRVEEAKERMR